jgi:hypothetical protein
MAYPCTEIGSYLIYLENRHVKCVARVTELSWLHIAISLETVKAGVSKPTTIEPPVCVLPVTPNWIRESPCHAKKG